MEKNKKVKKEKIETIIIAPHPDDEIIGCYSVLTHTTPIIIYSPNLPLKRREEALKLKEHTDVRVQLFQSSVPSHFLEVKNIFYFPDPATEVHPLHRQWGMIGEQILRSGFDVIFYTTTMQVPYISEVNEPDKKEELLNKVYPSQKNLWEYEKKYILFEGYQKWLIQTKK